VNPKCGLFYVRPGWHPTQKGGRKAGKSWEKDAFQRYHDEAFLDGSNLPGTSETCLLTVLVLAASLRRLRNGIRITTLCSYNEPVRSSKRRGRRRIREGKGSCGWWI
jgi:hypothetical protein